MHPDEKNGPAPELPGEPPWQPDDAEDEPDDPDPELLDPGNLMIDEPPSGDDAYWDAFIPDDDECDPLPEPGDFWMEESQETKGGGMGRSWSLVPCH